ncbi:MAG TPA: thioredoxin [Jiangellaceae bacterium]
MATVEMTAANFDDLTDDGIVLVDFWAAWCGPCRQFAPVFEEASERHPDVTFGKVDTDVEQELAQGFAIRSIPTIMAIRDGVIVFQQPGALNAQLLESLISQVKALDMARVQQQ